MTKKLLRKSANFAPSPSLLSAVPNAVKIGAGVGGGLGLLQGAGVFESDAEKRATNVGNRLGKVLTSTTVGTGLGAGVGYGVNRYKAAVAPERELQRREAEIVAKKAEIAASRPNRLKLEVDAVAAKVQPIVAPTREQRIEQAEREIAKKLERQSTQEPPTPLIDQAISWERNIAAKTQEKVGGLLDRLRGKSNPTQREAGGGIPPNTVNVNSTTELSKMIRKSANFQDPATIQRLIQHGSTYIPQNNTGVVSLESTLRGKMQKKKLREPKVPASMGVKEINSMIESGKPVGKYFNKTIRKSANFLKRQQQAEFGIGDQINKGLVSAGKLITQPAARTLRKAATKAGGGNLASVTGNRIVAGLPFGIADKVNYGAAKAAVGTHDALNSVAKVLDTDKAAKYAAIGVGGTALAGGGLLAASALKKKQEDEARYSKNIRKSANFNMEFLPDIDYKGLSHLGITAGGALAGGLAGRAFSGKEIPMEPKIKQQHDYLLQQVLNNPQDTQAGDNYNRFMVKYQNSASSQQQRRNTLGATIGAIGGGLAANTGDVIARYSGGVRKSANFGIVPTNLIQGAQKIARGAANRFGSLSPQINAANVGTAVGAGLGALEGSGINETEEQRRSTGLVGRAGKVLGMTGLGAGVGRGVGSVAGAGVNRYQANQRLQNRRKDNPDAFKNPASVPRQIDIE